MINFRNAKYILSCPDYTFRPKDNLPEIVFLGRSNVGKSTLINSLTAQKIAFNSKKAGKTKYLNYFLIDKRFYLVDSPGYGFTAYGSEEDQNFDKMMEGYFHNPQLKGCIFLLDARRGSLNKDDEVLFSYLKKEKVKTVLVFTKCDKANQSELSKCRDLTDELGLEMAYFASPKGNVNVLRAALDHLLSDK